MFGERVCVIIMCVCDCGIFLFVFFGITIIFVFLYQHVRCCMLQVCQHRDCGAVSSSRYRLWYAGVQLEASKSLTSNYFLIK